MGRFRFRVHSCVCGWTINVNIWDEDHTKIAEKYMQRHKCSMKAWR